MGAFDWISKQVDRQIGHIQQAQAERAAAEKQWLANPYGMDPELQKNLVAEATQKRDAEFAAQQARVPKPDDPYVDYEKQLAEYNHSKAQEEGTDTKRTDSPRIIINLAFILEIRKKQDEEFEARRLQRIWEQRPNNVSKSQHKLAPSVTGLNPVPTGFMDVDQGSPHGLLPSSPEPQPQPIPPPMSYHDTSEFILATIAKMQTVKPLPKDMWSLLGQEGSAPSISHQRQPVPGCLSFLRNDPEFIHIRSAIQQEPALLKPFLQKIEKENPNLALLIFHNEDEFNQLMAETGQSTRPLPADLEFLKTDLKFEKLRKQVQRKPERLRWLMQKLVEDNPYQATILAANESHFIEWLNIGSDKHIGPVSEAIIRNSVDTPITDLSAPSRNFPTFLHTTLPAFSHTALPSSSDTALQNPVPGAFPTAIEATAPEDLSFLNNNTEFLRLRLTYQARPRMLNWLTEKFMEKNPEFKSLIEDNITEFHAMMNHGFSAPSEDTDDFGSKNSGDTLSPKRKSRPEAAPYYGDGTRKQVSFTDSTIRADNNMDTTPKPRRKRFKR